MKKKYLITIALFSNFIYFVQLCLAQDIIPYCVQANSSCSVCYSPCLGSDDSILSKEMNTCMINSSSLTLNYSIIGVMNNSLTIIFLTDQSSQYQQQLNSSICLLQNLTVNKANHEYSAAVTLNISNQQLIQKRFSNENESKRLIY